MQENETSTVSEVTVRRSPRYGRFVVTTIVVFVLASFGLAYGIPVSGDYSQSQVFGYMILVSIALGIPVGGVLALIIDRAMGRTARTVLAERTDARGAADADDTGVDIDTTGADGPEDTGTSGENTSTSADDTSTSES